MAAALLLSAAACGGEAARTEGGTSSAAASDWEVVDPATVGLDAGKLDQLRAFVDNGPTTCAAVVKDGKVADAWYFGGMTPESDQEVFSVTKSVASTLVGIAQARGYLDIDQPASDFLTEWKGTPSEPVTIREILSQDSGRVSTFENDFVTMPFATADQTAFALGLPQQHPPGSHWEYSNSGVQTLEAVLERATGEDVERFAQDNLFHPIGMDVSIRRDAAGNPLLYMGLQAGCLDVARFGWLFEQQGSWNGVQIVPAEWVEEATTPSQQLNKGYGLLWWLNSGGSDGTGPVEAPAWPDAPADAYAAQGMGDQEILVLPSQHTVVVRLGTGLADASRVNDVARLTVAATTP